MLSASDGSSGSSGVLGLLLSDTDNPTASGAVFDLLRVESATQASGGGSSSGGSSSGSSSGGSSSSGSSSGGSSSSGSSSGGSSTQPVGNIPGTWTLAFDDEFNATSLDSSKWTTMNGGGWGSTTCDASNVAVSGGNLVLTLASASSGACACTGSACAPAFGGSLQRGLRDPTISPWAAIPKRASKLPKLRNGNLQLARVVDERSGVAGRRRARHRRGPWHADRELSLAFRGSQSRHHPRHLVECVPRLRIAPVGKFGRRLLRRATGHLLPDRR